MKLKDIGEHEYIERIVKKYLDIDNLDDVFWSDGNVFKIDGFSLSFKSKEISLYDIGWKGSISTFSDLIASGSLPIFVMSSIGINSQAEESSLEEILKGLSDCVRYYGAKYVGGDLNSSSIGWLDVVGVGKKEVTFSFSPRNGDVLILTNPIGYTSLYFLSKIVSNIELPKNIMTKILEKIRHPVINKSLIKVQSYASENLVYSTDISDGLLISLDKLRKRLNMGIELTKFGIANNIIEFIESNRDLGFTLDQLLKYSGEEYETVLVIHKEAEDEVLQHMKKLGFNPVVIGHLSEKNDIIFNNNRVKIAGWDNFKGWF